MKKWIFCVLALILVLTGCGEKAPAQGVSGTPEEIIEKIYENHKKVNFSLVNMELDLQDENAVAYNTGLSSGEKLSGAMTSEPMQGQAYSLVVARVKDAADAAQVAKDMYEKVNTRKWICVEADTKTAAYCGDVVMFFMVNSEFSETATVESMLEAFQKVCGGNARVVG